MNSAALLDLLGNENRRRILQLLARKPCYVTEMSEQLGVSPKAIIDHLRKLEAAGLVESHVDDRRRKYFHIARNLRLEVTVSPYRFGTKSAYPESFDLTRCRHLSIEVTEDETDAGGERTDPREPVAPGQGSAATGRAADDGRDADDGGEADPDPRALAARLDRLEELEDELSLAQRWVQAQLTDAIERVGEMVGDDLDERLYADVLLAVQDGAETVETVAERTGAPRDLVNEALSDLADTGFLDERDGRWRVA